MSRFKRRLLICTAIVVVLLVALVAFFYRPIRAALKRAEAFQFRRMLVTRIADQDTFRFFYVTNRRLDSEKGPIEEPFDNQRDENLKFWLFDTTALKGRS